MNRVVLPDGRWFDSDQATKWEHKGGTLPGDPSFRQVLWRTRNGQFILEHWVPDGFAGLDETLRERSYFDDQEGIGWLLAHGEQIPDDLSGVLGDMEV